jgi:hypothetical protein
VSNMVYESPDKDDFPRLDLNARQLFFGSKEGSLGRPHLTIASPGYLHIILFS